MTGCEFDLIPFDGPPDPFKPGGGSWNLDGDLDVTGDILLGLGQRLVFEPDTYITAPVDNQLHFFVGGTQISFMDAGSFFSRAHFPIASDSFDLGSISRLWQDLFLSGDADMGLGQKVLFDDDDDTWAEASADDVFRIATGGVVVFELDDDATALNTRLKIWDVDNATLERVSVGAADSGGAGFKVLRIPN